MTILKLDFEKIINKVELKNFKKVTLNFDFCFLIE